MNYIPVYFRIVPDRGGLYMYQLNMNDFTEILHAAAHGKSQSAETLLPLVYEELRKLAHARMAKEAPNHTLQPTALVHEAWLRMVDDEERTWQNRAYFFSAASTAMRRILVDHARSKTRLKRGGDHQRLYIDQHELADSEPDDRILMVDDALLRLEATHPQWAQIVVMKYFGGMSNKEAAEALDIGERTVDRYWACARAWLYRRIRAQL